MNVDDRIVPRLASLAAVLMLLAPACAKKAGTDMASPPSSEGGDYAMKAGDDPLAELDSLEGRMRELGLPVAESKRADKANSGDREFAEAPDEAEGAIGGVETAAELGEDEPSMEEALAPAPMDASPGAGPSRDDSASPCDDVCGLNEAICDLEIRICEMSETHEGDPTYADACERAIDDCSTSGDACDACHG